MVTAVIRTGDDIEALGATLAALVPAVAQGVVRDAVVVDGSAGDNVRITAEAAGTAYVKAEPDADAWRLGASAGKGLWVLLLEAGDVPGGAWIAEVERFVVAAGPSSARSACLRRDELGLGSAIGAILRRLTRGVGFGPGLLCPRAALLAEAVPARIERLSARLHRVAARRA